MSLRLTLRVAAPSIGISLLLLVLGGLGGWYILNLQKRTADLLALDMATLRSVEQLVAAPAQDPGRSRHAADHRAAQR